MPVVGGRYIQRDEDEILDFLESELKEEFGEDIDLTESSAFKTFATALASLDAEEVEPALEEVYGSAFLEDAEEEDLEKVVAILGIERRDAVNATGVIEFSHSGTVEQDHTIPNGTIVQTDSDDPVGFETSELVTLSVFDRFESGSLSGSYNGDTADFNVVDGTDAGDPSPTDGSFMVRADASSGSKIYQINQETHVGCTMDFRLYIPNDTATDGVAHNMFGVSAADDYYRVVVDSSGTHSIEVVISDSSSSLASSSTTIPTDEWLRNEIEWSPKDGGTITSKIYDSNEDLVDEVEVSDEDTITSGGWGFESGDAGENKYWDHSGLRSVQADSRAREGGTVGNVASNTLVVLPSTVSGVDSVTNPWPMGDPDRYLTNLTTFVTGLEEETDSELRDRAGVSEGALGKATIPALIANLTSLDGAQSVTLFENKTNTDNTGSGGLPPKSFEVVFYGTTPNADIAESIFETRAFTARDYGGSSGTEVTEDVTASNDQEFTVRWSEPNALEVDITIDIVVNDNYIGDDPLRNRIVEYVGGTRADGTEELGTGVGEDVYVDQIEDAVVGPDDTGVVGIASYSFTPSITTDSNGLEIVSVGGNEVAQTNGEDGSITITTTEV